MKSNFALSLSFDGLRLMHRVPGGWHLVGQVALDDADVTGSLAHLRGAAEELEPNGITTKLLIPNDQIKYLALDTTRAEEADVRDALNGATPYTIDELAYDFAKGGGRTYVAAVARETLEEAQQFATEHGFNPVSFAAVPEPFTYVGEAFFGATDGQSAERDAEPVVVIGQADVELPAPKPVTPVADETPAPVVEPDPIEEQTTIEEPAPATEIETETVLPPEPSVDPAPVAEDAPELEPKTPVEDSGAVDPEPQTPDADVVPPPPAPVNEARARNEGQPAEKPDVPQRAEPTFTRKEAPSLAVPKDDGASSVPPLAAPSRETDATPVATISTDAPEADTAPAITGEAATALSPDAAVAAASLTIEPDEQPADQTTGAVEDTDKQRGAAATALGAATAVGGAVGTMFASRRMARAQAKAEEAENPAEPARKSVFGARKQPKPKPVVGGKPRFLGLILTAILLLFLLAFAAFAALSEDGIAAWFGFGSEETQLASDPVSAPEVAAAAPTVTAPADASDALAAPTAPSGGHVLSPEEASRIYAATGVWQRAPRIPLNPRTTSLDNMIFGAAPAGVTRVPPSPLTSSSSISGDAVIATPIDPPAPDATFDFGSDGLIVATPQGNITPDGILVIAGAPPLNPPTRPGTIAPEITPQDQLAAVVPDTATPITDAPAGVIIISGRPSIEPPVRPGTTAPAALPQAEVLATGDAPLLATDGLLVLAGSPSILPPVRPGTIAPTAIPAAAVETSTPDALPDTPDVEGTAPEGLNVIAGAPPILPPARPGTNAPQPDNALDSLSSDVAAALNLGTAQTPAPDTRRPQLRPAAVIQAAAAVANAPILGALTASEASAFRPRTRPAGLAPAPAATPDPDPAPQEAAAPHPQAFKSRPRSPPLSRPDPRPRNMDRIVARANQAQERAAAQVASVQPTAVAPSGPTGSAVAQNATLDNAINLRDMNLIGIYGGNSDRRALVRLSNGRYVRVTVGDRLDGGRVTAISAGALSYTKRGRALTLEVAG
ncbi:hypothetical protein GQR58_002065 [Nymphon striatum]|nr:hypothetical protein GQR58_002065 [Nymphon striatum]